RNDPDNGFYGGMRVTGDMVIDNGLYVQSQYPPAYINDLSSEKFYNVPYLFVDGALMVKNTGISLVNFDRGGTSTEGLLNLYCDTISVAAGGDLTRLAEGNVNIMITGEGKDNTFKFEDSHLIDWATKTITGVTNKGGINSGNFYCKGNLNNTGKSIDINGDFIVMGNVTTAGEIRVHGGYAYVGGTVTGNVKVDDTYKLLQNIGGTSSTANFLANLRAKDGNLDADGKTKSYPDAKDAATRFETAFKIKADGVDGIDYVQTHDNILKQFKDTASGGYKDVVETSDYAGTDVWDGKSTITKSCIWNSSCPMGDQDPKTININPGDQDIWINIASDLKTISNKTIIVDDSKGGSVRFFIEDGATTLNLPMTKIITKTYYDIIFGSSPSLAGLSAYPESKMVPQIYMYASSTNEVVITMDSGKYIFTGDLIAPKATFKGGSSNGVYVPVKYTYFNYFDINKDGKIDADEQANPVTIDRTMEVMFIGSLEVGNIDVTNLFGYLYVDDPPFNGGPAGIVKDYQWTTLDGYSTY
ncbi:MAG: hypothetical protein Q4E99_06220, partial [Bacillota bacterium]|nr:hypothetical protein [Bacillota bacterium]